MDKIKKFIDCFVPVYNCNFKCKYCYISTWEGWKQEENSKEIKYSPELIRKALSQKRWGGPLMLNFCGAGETLLCKELLPIIKELLAEGHYCMIVTNGTITPKFNEMAEWPDELKEHLFIKFSYHFLELKRLKLTSKFFDNVRKMKENGISFTVEVTPSDEYIPYIEEMKEECMREIGALPHITVCRIENGNVPLMSKLPKEEFIRTWENFDSELFNFKIDIFGEERKEFCYAGAWSYTLQLVDGTLRQCYRGRKLQNIFEDINAPIKEIPIGCNCLDAHCWNGHAFLAFGDIPEMKTPTFEKERNRKTENGDWVTKKMADFMSTKLSESNKTLNDKQKKKFNKKSKQFRDFQGIKHKIKKVVKGNE